jgi:hypothetical protein
VELADLHRQPCRAVPQRAAALRRA